MNKIYKRIINKFSNDFEKPNLLPDFFDFDIRSFEQELCGTNEQQWIDLGKRKAVRLFHSVAKRVPAYGDFLKKHKINPRLIRSVKDFAILPITTKQNYIEKYDLKSRMWDGVMPERGVIAASSGTTGTPKFWPRGFSQEFEAAVSHELIYRNFFHIEHCKTLLIVGFPVGLNVSGMATVLPSYAVAARGYDLTLAPIGTNKLEILRVIETVQGVYDQIILAAHPFFAKDIMESLAVNKKGVHQETPIRFLFASEGFSEIWREYINSFSHNVHETSAISVYGCADMLLVATETPLSIAIKNKIEADPGLANRIFNRSFAGSLFQYHPLLRYIESVDSRLVFTVASGAPLVRFHPGDSGEVLSYSQILDGLDLGERCQELFKSSTPVWKLPFVALFGRSDFTLPFYFTNIDPTYIKLAIEKEKFFNSVTGKFSLRNIGGTGAKKQILEINIELCEGVNNSKSLSGALQKEIIRSLMTRDYRYEYMCSVLKKTIIPRIILWPYKHEKYFKAGRKPQYIITG